MKSETGTPLPKRENQLPSRMAYYWMILLTMILLTFVYFFPTRIDIFKNILMGRGGDLAVKHDMGDDLAPDVCSPIPLEGLPRFTNDPMQLGTFPDVTVPCHDTLAIEMPLIDLNGITSHNASSFKIIDPNRAYHVGDILTVNVHTKDYRGNAKAYGGDFLIGRIVSDNRKSSAIGILKDHANGNYTLSFVLRWPGVTHVEVLFVHSSEAVAKLEVVREAIPDKIAFWGIFGVSEKTQEITACGARLPTKGRKICNLTEPALGEPWFCYSPRRVPCTSLQWHVSNNTDYHLSKETKEIFKREKTHAFLKAVGNAIVFVKDEGVQAPQLPLCGGTHINNSNANARGARVLNSRVHQLGYYLDAMWQPANCRAHRFPTAKDISACLRGRIIHLLGDSTVRQWYELLLASAMPTMKKVNLHTDTVHPPGLAVDENNDIFLRYAPHGFPFFCGRLLRFKEFRHVALEVDAISGGRTTVVAVSLGAHFVPFSLVDASLKLINVRAAILRLLARSPETTVVIKTINIRETNLIVGSFSNWLAFRVWALTRRVFVDLPVVIIDTWEMTASLDRFDLHPVPWIVRNQVELFLAHVCPV